MYNEKRNSFTVSCLYANWAGTITPFSTVGTHAIIVDILSFDWLSTSFLRKRRLRCPITKVMEAYTQVVRVSYYVWVDHWCIWQVFENSKWGNRFRSIRSATIPVRAVYKGWSLGLCLYLWVYHLVGDLILWRKDIGKQDPLDNNYKLEYFLIYQRDAEMLCLHKT